MPSPFKRRLIVLSLLSVLLLLCSGYLGMRYYDQTQLLIEQQHSLARQQQHLLALNVDMQALLSAQEARQVKLDLQAQQLAEQAQELALYQVVLSPKGGKLALVQQEIVPASEPRVFAYRLVLLQPRQGARKVTGQAQLKVRAIHNKQSQILTGEMLGVAPVTLDFRHFQVLMGQLRLPLNSQARTLELRLTLDNRADRTLSIHWPVSDNT
ncbi:DUF6776 family protein [Oceanisphaera pacifica]|uniref:DUF3251 domain-containing protein n=1 Tax=Oceanisphaera pacifica TaxID=2818389 RepID=A0ABS3NJ76_9GAMM|nr:DUF6776 family protein [Oceanisphaera pacifica]MBO1520367.1 hypothetical protein [Oceanisphaera pacifica]